MKGRELLIFCMQRSLLNLRSRGLSIPQVDSHAMEVLLCDIAFKLEGEALEWYLAAGYNNINTLQSVVVYSI